MIQFTEKGDALSFQVYVVPRASRSEIAGEYNGALKVRIAAPPVNGAANRELIQLLAKLLDVPRSNIEIASGEGSKLKRISVTDCAPRAIQSITKRFASDSST